MNHETIPRTVLFPDLFDRPLVATFDRAHASSDGGAMLLTAADARLGVTAALAGGLTDGRTAEKMTHTVHDLVAPRVCGIVCGSPDANDADRLADDPIQTWRLDRDPIEGPTHGAQPLSFFNGHDDRWCSLPRLACVTFNDEAERRQVD